MAEGKGLVTGGLALFVATVAGGALGYVYQIVLVRLLGPPEYGSVAAMMAIYYVASVPLGAASLFLARQFARDLARSWYSTVQHGFYTSCRNSIWVAALLAAVLAIFSRPIAEHFDISTGAAIAYALMVGAAAFTPAPTALLQATHSFGVLAANNVGTQLGKTVLGITLVSSGLGAAGAFAGVGITTAVLVLCIVLWARAHFRAVGRGAADDETSRKERVSAFLPILAANLAFACMSQLDVLLVREYFPADQAGSYAAAALLGKASMYLPSGLVMAMFPMVAARDELNRSSIHLLLQALAVSIGLSAVAAAAYWWFAEPLVTVLYGASYEGAGQVLKYYGGAMIPLAAITVLDHFLLAKRRVFFAYLMLAVPVAQWLLLRIYHDNLIQAVWILTATACALLVVAFIVILMQTKAQPFAQIRRLRR